VRLNKAGFTLVELVAILLIVGVLAVSAFGRLQPSSTMQLQASRDSIVAAFYSAQQLAMTQLSTVELITTTTQVDIHVDGSSVTVGGVSYPFTLIDGQTLTATTYLYDRLGYTSAGFLMLSQNGRVVSIDVQESGYVRGF